MPPLHVGEHLRLGGEPPRATLEEAYPLVAPVLGSGRQAAAGPRPVARGVRLPRRRSWACVVRSGGSHNLWSSSPGLNLWQPLQQLARQTQERVPVGDGLLIVVLHGYLLTICGDLLQDAVNLLDVGDRPADIGVQREVGQNLDCDQSQRRVIRWCFGQKLPELPRSWARVHQPHAAVRVCGQIDKRPADVEHETG